MSNLICTVLPGNGRDDDDDGDDERDDDDRDDDDRDDDDRNDDDRYDNDAGYNRNSYDGGSGMEYILYPRSEDYRHQYMG